MNNNEMHVVSPELFLSNTQHFNALMMMYRSTIREIRTKLEVLDDEFSIKYNRNPISSIKTRIKTPSSIYEKLKKMGFEFTEKNIREQLNDVAGIRVICPFIDDIYTIANLIGDQDDITIVRIKDYIMNPKPNGYRSYHMIVEIPIFFAEGKTPMRAEIQIRTLAMDFWASVEHQLRYKKNISDPKQCEIISQELLKCAQTLTETDNQMQSIKKMIGELD